MKNISILIFALGLLAAPAMAAPPANVPATAVLGSSHPSVAVTATSAPLVLKNSAAYQAMTISNYGTKDVYFALGGASVVATTSSNPLRAGKHITVWINGNADVAFICGGTDTSTVDVYEASGPVSIGQ